MVITDVFKNGFNKTAQHALRNLDCALKKMTNGRNIHAFANIRQKIYYALEKGHCLPADKINNIKDEARRAIKNEALMLIKNKRNIPPAA